MKQFILLLLTAIINITLSLGAQTVEVDIPEPEIPKTRYFLSTNLLNLATLDGNIALEVRFKNNFALKTSLFGGLPWFFNDFSEDDLTSLLGIHVEPRWYVNNSRSLHFGFSINSMLFTGWERARYDHHSDEYIDHGRWVSSDGLVIWGMNGVAGYYLRVTPRFGVDFSLGVGVTFLGGYMPVPFGEAGVSLSWELGRKHKLPPLSEKRSKRRR